MSAELYAFARKSPFHYIDCKLIIVSGLDAVCMYTTVGSSPPTLGLSSCLWRPPQCPLRHRPALADKRRSHDLPQASKNHSTFTLVAKYELAQ